MDTRGTYQFQHCIVMNIAFVRRGWRERLKVGGKFVGDRWFRENTSTVTASLCSNSAGEWYPDLMQFSRTTAITKQVTSYFDQQHGGAYNSCGVQNVPHSNLASMSSFVSPSDPSRTWITLLTSATFWNSMNAPACSVRDPVSAPAGTQSMRMRG